MLSKEFGIMRKKSGFVTLAVIMLLLPFIVSAEEKIEVGAPEWQTYVYEENGVMKGFAYKIVKDVLERAGVSYDFKIYPWARAYNQGLEKKNFLLVGVGRTPKRENLFHWIGGVAKGSDIYFYKLKSNPIRMNSLKDARQHKIGVERASYYYEYLVLNGFEKEKEIHEATHPEQLLKMLSIGRLPLILLDESRLSVEAEQAGLDPNLFEKAFFAFEVTENMAFSKNTSPELVQKVRNAYQELVREGKIRTMLVSIVEE